MAGHAVFMRTDGQVFAHIHPAGSVSMTAAQLAQGGKPGSDMDMSSMATMNAAPPMNSEVTFPFGFSQPGEYRIFVQIKRAGHIETGSFVARVQDGNLD